MGPVRRGVKGRHRAGTEDGLGDAARGAPHEKVAGTTMASTARPPGSQRISAGTPEPIHRRRGHPAARYPGQVEAETEIVAIIIPPSGHVLVAAW